VRERERNKEGGTEGERWREEELYGCGIERVGDLSISVVLMIVAS
jgi:hypothetical protein